jgi:hypothetical protein
MVKIRITQSSPGSSGHVGEIIETELYPCTWQKGTGGCKLCPGKVKVPWFREETCLGWGSKICYEVVGEVSSTKAFNIKDFIIKEE